MKWDSGLDQFTISDKKKYRSNFRLRNFMDLDRGVLTYANKNIVWSVFLWINLHLLLITTNLSLFIRFKIPFFIKKNLFLGLKTIRDFISMLKTPNGFNMKCYLKFSLNSFPLTNYSVFSYKNSSSREKNSTNYLKKQQVYRRSFWLLSFSWYSLVK